MSLLENCLECQQWLYCSIIWLELAEGEYEKILYPIKRLIFHGEN